MDSQSVKTSRLGGECRSFGDDAMIIGRKRPIVSNTMGLLPAVGVHAANAHDSKGASDLCY